MQVKKEVLLFFTLLILCITLITAADFSKSTAVINDRQAPCPTKCCKTNIKTNSNTSPWNFITQGILHLAV